VIRDNKTKGKLRKGEIVFGIFIPFAAPDLIELCGLAGFDYAIIDAEHGPLDVSACAGLVRAAEVAGVTPLVRIPTSEPSVILRLLDMGVQGIMVPHVSSKEDAERAVALVKYPPLGKRGMGSMRAAAFGRRVHRSEWVRHSNAETLVIAMLEDEKAIENLSDILSVPHIDAFEIGTGDLSLSMGIPGDVSNPRVQAAVDRIVSSVLAAGRVLGDTANDPESAADLIRRGYRMIDCSLASVATKALTDLVAGMRAAGPG
jgi:4-hydroxy-2-oxoheptanedioate aldolase